MRRRSVLRKTVSVAVISAQMWRTTGFRAVDGGRFKDPLVVRLERFRRRFAGFGEPVSAYLAALQCDEQLIVGPVKTFVSPGAK